jgi:hypothetical protein
MLGAPLKIIRHPAQQPDDNVKRAKFAMAGLEILLEFPEI